MKRLVISFFLTAWLLSIGVALASPVNINQANAQQISQSLIGVGLKKAQAIVDYREQYGDFTNHEQLIDVKGIGPQTLEKNKARIIFAE